MQSLVPDPRANYRNMFHALSQIIRDESVWSTMSGIDATAYGSGPAHAVYFACYEYLKKTLSRPNEGNHLVHGMLHLMHKLIWCCNQFVVWRVATSGY